MNKLKILWFGLVPLGWILCRWLLVKAEINGAWAEHIYNANSFWWELTAIFGSILIMICSVGLAIYLQED